MLTKTSVKRGGSKFEALLLVPLSVAFEYRKRGIGLRMVKESFELARNIGYRFVFVVGNPPHFIVGSVSSHPVLFSALSMFLQFLTKTLWFMSYTLAH
jgi:predicted N-acetyltransferase YhbS